MMPRTCRHLLPAAEKHPDYGAHALPRAVLGRRVDLSWRRLARPATAQFWRKRRPAQPRGIHAARARCGRIGPGNCWFWIDAVFSSLDLSMLQGDLFAACTEEATTTGSGTACAPFLSS